MKKLLLLVTISVTFLNCKKEDTPKTTKGYLIGSWKLQNKETFQIENEVEKSEIFTNKTNGYVLTFLANNKVYYKLPGITDNITGDWKLEETNIEKVLYTDLSISVPTTTGYSKRYFFPKSKITFIDNTIMKIESMNIKDIEPGLKIDPRTKSTFVKL